MDGTGEVVLARHPRFARRDVLRVVSDPELRDAVQSAADTMAGLRRPGIVRVHDRGVDGDRVWVATEYVEGPTLGDVIGRGPLPAGQVTQVADELAAVLDELADNGVVHGRLRPTGVRVDAGGHARLTGIGTVLSGTDVGETFDDVGFTAPELRAGRPVDATADQYSLACIVFAMITGSQPFNGTTPDMIGQAHVHEPPPAVSSRLPGVGPAVDQVLFRALEKNPRDRFPSSAAFVAALRQAVGVGGARVEAAHTVVGGPALRPVPSPVPAALPAVVDPPAFVPSRGLIGALWAAVALSVLNLIGVLIDVHFVFPAAIVVAVVFAVTAVAGVVMKRSRPMAVTVGVVSVIVGLVWAIPSVGFYAHPGFSSLLHRLGLGIAPFQLIAMVAGLVTFAVGVTTLVCARHRPAVGLGSPVVSPQVYHGAPTPGGGSGFVLTTKYFPLSWFFLFLTPTVEIDGTPVRARWGDNRFDLAPGQHRVRIWVPYLAGWRVGPAETVVSVGPQSAVALEYRAPVWAFSAGSLGPSPQTYNGAGLALGMVLVPFVLFIVAILSMPYML
ncbi:serine/threonine-protein kinase [Gordonia spumicola]|nr:serine/threonine-protein kinase [Gordonia spumicola]